MQSHSTGAALVTICLAALPYGEGRGGAQPQAHSPTPGTIAPPSFLRALGSGCSRQAEGRPLCPLTVSAEPHYGQDSSTALAVSPVAISSPWELRPGRAGKEGMTSALVDVVAVWGQCL